MNERNLKLYRRKWYIFPIDMSYIKYIKNINIQYNAKRYNRIEDKLTYYKGNRDSGFYKK